MTATHFWKANEDTGGKDSGIIAGDLSNRATVSSSITVERWTSACDVGGEGDSRRSEHW